MKLVKLFYICFALVLLCIRGHTQTDSIIDWGDRRIAFKEMMAAANIRGTVSTAELWGTVGLDVSLRFDATEEDLRVVAKPNVIRLAIANSRRLTNLSAVSNMVDILELGLFNVQVTTNCLSILSTLSLKVFYCESKDLNDLSPIGSFKTLKRLHVSGPFTDIRPISRLGLTSLSIDLSNVSDISSLKDMKLESINIFETPVDSIASLHGMPLRDLVAAGSKIADLSPLKNAPLEKLDVSNTQVMDISMLKGMQLKDLNISYTKVSDISVLAGMPIRYLHMAGSLVTNILVIQEMPLAFLTLGQNLKNENAFLISELENKGVTVTIEGH